MLLFWLYDNIIYMGRDSFMVRGQTVHRGDQVHLLSIEGTRSTYCPLRGPGPPTVHRGDQVHLLSIEGTRVQVHLLSIEGTGVQVHLLSIEGTEVQVHLLSIKGTGVQVHLLPFHPTLLVSFRRDTFYLSMPGKIKDPRG